jgi:predicted RNase H-like HicB family nuclease
MQGIFILSDYIERALAQAEYDKLEDGTFSGRIPGFSGVIAFGTTLRECETELRSTLEDWVLVGLKLGHELPVIADLNLNKKPAYEPLDSV